jgi:hypothetical protein
VSPGPKSLNITSAQEHGLERTIVVIANKVMTRILNLIDFIAHLLSLKENITKSTLVLLLKAIFIPDK